MKFVPFPGISALCSPDFIVMQLNTLLSSIRDKYLYMVF